MANPVLSYMEYGDKSRNALVFLHGFMGSKHDWQHIANYFSLNNFCITIDLPGHGKSIDIQDANYDIASTSKAIVDILDYLNIGMVSLIGYSMGGRIALHTALNYPERIQKLVLESSSPGLKTEEEREIRRENDLKLAKKILNSDFEEFLDEWYDLPFFRSLKLHPDYKEMIKKRLQNDLTGITKSLIYMGTGNQPSLWVEWVSTKTKSLLISGALDSKYCAVNQEMSKLNPYSKHIIVQSAGHNVHFEEREIFIEYLKDFLSE